MANNSQALELLGSSKKFGAMLEEYREDILAVLPANIDGERYLKVAMLAATRQPKLLQCTRASIIEALMTATSLGLEVNGILGSGYLIPYDKYKDGRLVATIAQFQPGYRGLIDLARRSGAIKSIWARLVYSCDQLSIVQGTHEKLEHIPNLKEPGKLKDYYCAYAVAQIDGAEPQFDIMTAAQIEYIRSRSKSGADATFEDICAMKAKKIGPWGTDYEEMAKKTVVKRLAKYLPLNAEVAAAIALDDRIESGDITGVAPELDTEASLARHMAERARESTDDLRARAENLSRDSVIEAEVVTPPTKFEGVAQATPKEVPKQKEIRLMHSLAKAANLKVIDESRSRYGINPDQLSPAAVTDFVAYLRTRAPK